MGVGVSFHRFMESRLLLAVNVLVEGEDACVCYMRRCNLIAKPEKKVSYDE